MKPLSGTHIPRDVSQLFVKRNITGISGNS